MKVSIYSVFNLFFVAFCMGLFVSCAPSPDPAPANGVEKAQATANPPTLNPPDTNNPDSPGLAPSSHKIIFEAYPANLINNGKLVVMDVDGANRVDVTDATHSLSTANVAPSPDGKYAVFASAKESGEQIWLWNRQNNSIAAVTSFANDWITTYDPCLAVMGKPPRCFSWSHDSRELVFRVETNFLMNDDSPTSGMLYKLDMNDIANIGPVEIAGQQISTRHAPVYAPNNKRIAYIEQSGSNFRLWVISEAGENRLVWNSPSYVSDLSWSKPDGAHILVTQSVGGDSSDVRIKYVNTLTGLETLVGSVFRTDVKDTHPSWSPDGKKIVFVTRTPAQQGSYSSHLNYFDVGTGVITTLISDNEGIISNISWLSNDEVIYVSYKQTGDVIMRTPVPTVNPTELSGPTSLHPRLLK